MSDVREFVSNHVIEANTGNCRVIEMDRVAGGGRDLADRPKRSTGGAIGGEHHTSRTGNGLRHRLKRHRQGRGCAADGTGQFGHELVGDLLRRTLRRCGIE